MNYHLKLAQTTWRIYDTFNSSVLIAPPHKKFHLCTHQLLAVCCSFARPRIGRTTICCSRYTSCRRGRDGAAKSCLPSLSFGWHPGRSTKPALECNLLMSCMNNTSHPRFSRISQTLHDIFFHLYICRYIFSQIGLLFASN